MLTFYFLIYVTRGSFILFIPKHILYLHQFQIKWQNILFSFLQWLNLVRIKLFVELKTFCYFQINSQIIISGLQTMHQI